LFKIRSEQKKESQQQKVKSHEDRTKEIEEEERQQIERDNPWKPVEHVAPKNLREDGKRMAAPVSGGSGSGSGSSSSTTTTVQSRRRRRQEVIDVTAEVFAKSTPSVESTMRGPDVFSPSGVIPASIRDIQEQQEKEVVASRAGGIKASRVLDSSSSRAPPRGKAKATKPAEPSTSKGKASATSAWGSSAPKQPSFLDIQKEEMRKVNQSSPASGDEKPMSSVLMAPTSVPTSDAVSTSDDFFWGSVPGSSGTSPKPKSGGPTSAIASSKPTGAHRPGSYAALASKQPSRSQYPPLGSSSSHRPEKKMKDPSSGPAAPHPEPSHPVAETKPVVERITPVPADSVSEEETVSTDTSFPKMSPEMASWCRSELQRLTGSNDLTLAEYLFAIKSEHEVKELIWANLGHSSELSDFSEQYLRHRALELDSHEVKKGPSSTGWFPAPSSSTGSSTSSGETHRSRSSRRRNRRR
jgi:hypothetical protein